MADEEQFGHYTDWTIMQGLYESWKIWKGLKFYYGIFQDWKVKKKGKI